MKQIYIYCVRRAKIDNEELFIDLIPKLFTDLYNQEIDININHFVRCLKSKYNYNEQNKKEFINKLLHDKTSILFNQNINDIDYNTIVELNLNLINEDMPDNKFDKLIEHLYRGHGEMKYGLYFTIGFADNDEDFENKFIKEDPENPNLTILYYTQLPHFLNYIKKLDLQYKFIENQVYLNDNWSHGFTNKHTIYLIKSSDYYTDSDIELFILDIYCKYYKFNINNSTSKLRATELICKIPLDLNLFKSFFVSRTNNYYKIKYLKYKNKYLKYKNNLN